MAKVYHASGNAAYERGHTARTLFDLVFCLLFFLSGEALPDVLFSDTAVVSCFRILTINEAVIGLK